MKSVEEQIKGHKVRLFSSAGIGNVKEAETRATASLLSMVKAVSEFGEFFIKNAGGFKGKPECSTEVSFVHKPSKKVSRPDGVIVVVRGKKQWRALVEVKVGSNPLDQSQFDRYHGIASDEKFDALITISNQIALPNGLPPLKVDKRRLKRVRVAHISWERLLSEAQYLILQKGVYDVDQNYMLKEWIRYVNDPMSKIVVAPRVNQNWNSILSAASSDRLRSVKSDISEFSGIWAAFLRVQAFRLRAQLGEKVDVRLKPDERKDPQTYIKNLDVVAIETGKYDSSLVIPHTAGDLQVLLDLRSKRVFYEVQITPPNDKMRKGQITWIVNQLKKLVDVPSDLKLIVDWKKKGIVSQVNINEIEEKRENLDYDFEGNLVASNLEIKTFRIHLETRLSRKKTTVFNDIGGNLESFYRSVVEHLQVYTPRAPKLKSNNDENRPAKNSSSPNNSELSQIDSSDIPSWWNLTPE